MFVFAAGGCLELAPVVVVRLGVLALRATGHCLRQCGCCIGTSISSATARYLALLAHQGRKFPLRQESIAIFVTAIEPVLGVSALPSLGFCWAKGLVVVCVID